MQPLWSRNGQELFYVASTGATSRAVMAMRVEAGNSWNAGNPTKLFDDPYYHGSVAGRMYDVMPDGRRFLMIKQAGATETTDGDAFIVVQNWLQELKRLVR